MKAVSVATATGSCWFNEAERGRGLKKWSAPPGWEGFWGQGVREWFPRTFGSPHPRYTHLCLKLAVLSSPGASERNWSDTSTAHLIMLDTSFGVIYSVDPFERGPDCVLPYRLRTHALVLPWRTGLGLWKELLGIGRQRVRVD